MTGIGTPRSAAAAAVAVHNTPRARGHAMNEHDIVQHLRRVAPFARAHIDTDDLVGWPLKFSLNEAADEIERLRAELDAYRERNAWVERHD
jgi:hypothetical protein